MADVFKYIEMVHNRARLHSNAEPRHNRVFRHPGVTEQLELQSHRIRWVLTDLEQLLILANIESMNVKLIQIRDILGGKVTGPKSQVEQIAIALLVLALAPAPATALTYIESSTGLIPPTCDGGRTELEFGDVNGDGNPDLVSIGDHGNPNFNTDQHGLLVWLGDGAGNWSVRMSGNFGYGGVALGDVNNDGLMDAAYGMHHNYASGDFGNQLIEAALGDGTGAAWTPWDDGLATAGEDYGMFGTDLGDIDNDGDLDIGSCSFGCCAGVHIYRNQGNGSWSPVFGFTGGNADDDFVFGDVNADGFLDLAVVHASGTVYLGNGAGSFVNADANLPSGGSVGRRGLSLGDVDEDGDLDLAFRGSSGALELWLWNASGTWSDAAGLLPNSGIDATQLVDADGDGHLDVVAYGTRMLRVWQGNGGAAWTLVATLNFASPGEYAAMRAGGDVDHNGRPDLAIVTREGSFPNDRNRLRVFRESSIAAELGVRAVTPRGGEAMVGGSTRFLDWCSSVPAGESARVDLEYSLNGIGGPWFPIAADLPDNGRYQWRVPVVPPTFEARIRLTLRRGSEVAEAVTPRDFSILAPTSVSVPTGDDGRHLFRAVPNPSRGLVTLMGGASAEQAIEPTDPIEVLDAAGRCVRVLHAGSRVWDGRDLSGSDVPAGHYWLRTRRGVARVTLLR